MAFWMARKRKAERLRMEEEFKIKVPANSSPHSIVHDHPDCLVLIVDESDFVSFIDEMQGFYKR